MDISLGVVMDPISTINVKKDSTFAMLLEAQQRGWKLLYLEQSDLYVDDGTARAFTRELRVVDDAQDWYSLEPGAERKLSDIDVVLMRKDPPFDMEYIYTTYILELAAKQGTIVVNDPAALRDVNEKLSTAWFPQCCAPTLVSRDKSRLKSFLRRQGEIVVKPLDTMGGESVFRIRDDDPNTNVILETITQHETRMTMAQRFIPEYKQGDKRVLIIDGEPVPFALARIPAAGESRANLAAGGVGKGVELSERDYWICRQIGPVLRNKGILFAGLDVIGEFLTEINITSPTCIRELQTIYNINISARIMDAIIARLEQDSSSTQ